MRTAVRRGQERHRRRVVLDDHCSPIRREFEYPPVVGPKCGIDVVGSDPGDDDP